MSETFAAPANTGHEITAADFDVEAWLNGEHAFTKVVRVTNRPTTGLRLVELENELDAIDKERAENSASGKGSRSAGSRAGSAFTPAEVAIRDEMKRLLEELDSTWIPIELRPLDPFESNKLADTVKNRMDRLVAALVLTGTIGGKPRDKEFWHKLVKVIGGGQVLTVEETINKLSTAAVRPDFSVRVSSLLAGVSSS